MRKFTLSFFLVFFSVLSVYAQFIMSDSIAIFKKQKLTFDEANLVSSYYKQDGNNSAVTGGIGTEKLTDVANVLDFKFTSYNGRGIKHSIGAEVGVDYYTSASSDNIDFRVSSASSEDVRFYPSINYARTNEISKTTIGGNVAYSKEFDYTSYGGGLNYSKSFNNENTELSIKGNIFIDDYKLYLPIELRAGNPRAGIIESRKSFDFGAVFSQSISPKIQVSLLLDLAYQQGFLSTPFHRVYLQNKKLVLEALPTKRFKVPIGLRSNFYLSDRAIARTFYRYYQDDWGMKAHTAQLELPLRIVDKFTLSPFARYYNQKGVDYFKGFEQGMPSDEFITSDYDLSTFSSIYYGTGFRYSSYTSLVANAVLQSIELKAGFYNRSNGLNAFMAAIHFQVKGF